MISDTPVICRDLTSTHHPAQKKEGVCIGVFFESEKGEREREREREVETSVYFS